MSAAAQPREARCQPCNTRARGAVPGGSVPTSAVEPRSLTLDRAMKYLLWIAMLAACSKAETAPTPAHHEDRAEPAIAEPALTLEVRVDGAATSWKQDVFDRVPHFASANNSGETRDTWSLRELVHAQVGPNARVTAVVGDKTQAIDPADWADPAKTPIVHRTRRGWLKFRWADKTGTWGETVVKDVTAVEVAR